MAIPITSEPARLSAMLALETEQDPKGEEDEGEGEDLIENMEADYQHIAELDQYDAAMLDERKYQGMTFDERKLAEEEVRGLMMLN